jgi:hypothetical protein
VLPNAWFPGANTALCCRHPVYAVFVLFEGIAKCMVDYSVTQPKLASEESFMDHKVIPDRLLLDACRSSLWLRKVPQFR